MKNEDVIGWLRKAFSSNDMELNKKAIKDFIEYLDGLINFFRHHNNKFYRKSSVVVFCDNVNKSWTFKHLDFSAVGDLKPGEKDLNTLRGLENLRIVSMALLNDKE